MGSVYHPRQPNNVPLCHWAKEELQTLRHLHPEGVSQALNLLEDPDRKVHSGPSFKDACPPFHIPLMAYNLILLATVLLTSWATCFHHDNTQVLVVQSPQVL
jgi:hypothetical protein